MTREDLAIITSAARDLIRFPTCRAVFGADPVGYVGPAYLILRAARAAYRPERGPWPTYAGRAVRRSLTQEAGRAASAVTLPHGAYRAAIRAVRRGTDPGRAGRAATFWLRSRGGPDPDVPRGRPGRPCVADDLDQVGWLLDRLTAAERAFVGRRFGLDGRGGATLPELAAELGVTKQAVQAREARILGRLRELAAG